MNYKNIIQYILFMFIKLTSKILQLWIKTRASSNEASSDVLLSLYAVSDMWCCDAAIVTIDDGSDNTVGGSYYSAHQAVGKFAEHHIDMVSCVHRKCQTRAGVSGEVNKNKQTNKQLWFIRKRWRYKELHIQGLIVWHLRSRQVISTAIKQVHYIIS